MQNRGFISLILVVLISFSVWGILYSITKRNELLFVLIQKSRELQSARSAAYECKVRAIEMLTEDVHAHIVGSHPRCSIDSVVTTLCTFNACMSNEYGEVKEIDVSGKDVNSGYVFRLKTKLIFVNQPPFNITAVSTERI